MFAVFTKLESTFSTQMRTYATTYIPPTANTRVLLQLSYVSTATTTPRRLTCRLPRT
jgi:hypothetical protein